MRSDSTWFRELKWGVFVHYLATAGQTADDWNSQVDAFDVNRLAEQLDEVGARYFFLTIGQNSGHYCSPNNAYDSFVGVQPSKCSRRDLISDLYSAFAKYDIRLLVYLPSGAPDRDPIAMEKLQWQNGEQMDVLGPEHGLDKDGKPWGWKNHANLEFQEKWEVVIREWSMRWGENVHGWWFDGCYFANAMYRREEHPNFESFTAAAKAGNPNSLVAFNPGVQIPVICYSEYEDYTAGEIANSLPVSCSHDNNVIDGKVDGAQYHILSFLGTTWGTGPKRFSNELAAAYTSYINGLQGVVTWDVPTNVNGTIPNDFLDQLKFIGKSASSI